MRWHQPTIDYVRRRTAEGLSKKDIIRCLKRFVAREVYHALIDDHRSGAACAEGRLTSGARSRPRCPDLPHGSAAATVDKRPGLVQLAVST